MGRCELHGVGLQHDGRMRAGEAQRRRAHHKRQRERRGKVRPVRAIQHIGRGLL